MKVNKNKTLYFVVIALLLGLFNLISFLIPFPKGGSFWTGYVSITIAILISSVVLYIIFDKRDLKSRFYGVPLIYVLRSYVILQLILGITQMALPAFNYKYAIVVNAVILVFTIIGLISLTVGKEEIERVDEKVKQKIMYIREIKILVENLIDETTEDSLLQELKKIQELIKYSDPMSNVEVEKIEIEILDQIKLLDTLNNDEKQIKIKEVEKLLNKRNRIIKNYK